MTHGPEITDSAGDGASPVQLERLCGRYYWAAGYCRGRRVIEVACGTGQGLGYVAKHASTVMGCDLSHENLSVARRTYGLSMPLARVDAHQLPFKRSSVDVVLMLETLYFLPEPEHFVREAERVLRPEGQLLLSVINKDCDDYNPYDARYRRHYGAPQVAGLVAEGGFRPECFGALPMDEASGRLRIMKPVKRLAVRLRLVPEHMRAKLFLKRLAYGRLTPIPYEITDATAPFRPPVPIACDRPDARHQVILCAATRKDVT